MKMTVTVEFEVEVENLADEEMSADEAASAADLATYEAMAFVKGQVGYNLDAAESTTVDVDGHGECEVTWPSDLTSVKVEPSK